MGTFCILIKGVHHVHRCRNREGLGVLRRRGIQELFIGGGLGGATGRGGKELRGRSSPESDPALGLLPGSYEGGTLAEGGPRESCALGVLRRGLWFECVPEESLCPVQESGGAFLS